MHEDKKRNINQDKVIYINWKKVKNNLPIFIAFLVLTIKFVIDLLEQWDPGLWVLVILNLLLYATSIWAVSSERKEKKTVSKLKDEIEDLKSNNNKLIEKKEALEYKFLKNSELLIKAHLREIMREVDLDHNCRISLYRYEQKTQRFIIIGRDSENKMLLKTGRGSYPEDVGVIGEAWRKGKHYEELTEYQEDQDKWLLDTMAMGFDKKTALSLNMKSCVLLGYTLKKPSHNIGIILIESDKKGGFCNDKALESLTKRNNELVELLGDIIADEFSYTFESEIADTKGY